jgi:adenosylhomocysteine nucleosidase
VIAVVSPMRREGGALGSVAIGAGASCIAGLEQVLEDRRPDAVLIAGACGGLDPSLEAGGLVLCRQAVMEGRPELRPAASLFEAARGALLASGCAFVSSRLLTVERPVASRREKTELWNQHGAAGVDMESYLLAEAAEGRGVPWLALRAVLDPAGAALPASLAGWRDERDDLRMLLRLARRPQDLPGAIRLALSLRRALGALCVATRVVVAVTGAGIDAPRPAAPLAAREARGSLD